MNEPMEYLSAPIKDDQDRAERAERWADELGRKCCQLQDEIARLEAELDKAIAHAKALGMDKEEK